MSDRYRFGGERWQQMGFSAEAMVAVGVSDISADLPLKNLADAEIGRAGEYSNWVRMQERATVPRKEKANARLILSCGVGDRAAF